MNKPTIKTTITYIALFAGLAFAGYILAVKKPPAECNDATKDTHTYNEYVQACENMTRDTQALKGKIRAMEEHLTAQGFNEAKRKEILAKK